MTPVNAKQIHKAVLLFHIFCSISYFHLISVLFGILKSFSNFSGLLRYFSQTTHKWHHISRFFCQCRWKIAKMELFATRITLYMYLTTENIGHEQHFNSPKLLN